MCSKKSSLGKKDGRRTWVKRVGRGHIRNEAMKRIKTNDKKSYEKKTFHKVRIGDSREAKLAERPSY